MVLDVVGPLGAEDGDGVLVGLEAAGGVERSPGALLEVLSSAEGELGGSRLGRAVATAGPRPRNRELQQSEGAPKGRVGGEAGAEAAASRVDAELARDRVR